MQLAFDTDGGAAAQAAFGFIVLQTDETAEAELSKVFSRDGLALYHSRISSSANVTNETLQQMEKDLPRALAMLPTARAMDVVAFGCTSGATVIGTDRISELVRGQFPQAKSTDPMTAVKAALSHLNIKKVGLLTPYVPEVSKTMQRHLIENGFEISGFASFEQIKEATVARITEKSLLDGVVQLAASNDVDGVFVSCTNLRSFLVLDEAEKIIGKPVISSNQAMAWHMLSLAGIAIDGDMGPGRLFTAGAQTLS